MKISCRARKVDWKLTFFTDKDRILLIRLLQTARDQGRTFLDKANRKCTLENRNWAFLLKKAEFTKKTSVSLIFLSGYTRFFGSGPKKQFQCN